MNKTPVLPSEERNLATLKTLSTYLWPSKRKDLKTRVILALLCLIISKIVNVYVPFLYKKSIDELSISTAIALVPIFWIMSYGIARVLQQAFGELRDFIFANVAQHAQRRIGLQTFKHLHELSLSFHLNRETGGLSRVIERGTKGIQFVLSFMLFNIIPTIIEVSLVTVILYFQFGISFALITFGTIFFYVLFTLSITNWRVQFRRNMNQKDSEANTKAIDSLLNYETVKYFNNENHEYSRYDHALAGYENAAIKSQGTLSLLNIGQGIIIGVGLILVMWLAGKGVINKTLTIGDYVMVNTFLIQLYLPLNFLGFVYREMKQGLIDMEKMFELLKVNPQIQDSPNAKDLLLTKGEVEFRNVQFSYETERTILKSISFKIPPGKTLAVVGPSGAGKSTLSRLLFRFYDASAGSILIDGQDIRNVSQSTLRRSIGIVPQDTVLFNDTIEYNIRYGDTLATSEQVIEAAKLAQLDKVTAALPQGYKTIVGERGLKLSGGEKQRVAIARTFLKNPGILIFDEATSALDSHTEKEIQQSLNEISLNRTTLVIAHRLSTIIDADEILVLKEGEVVERGNHQQLLSLNKVYASMWKRQQEAIKEEEAKNK